MPKSQHIARLVPGALVCLLAARGLHAQACMGLATPNTPSRLLSTTGAGTNLGRSLVARYGHTGQRLFGGVQLGAAGSTFGRLSAPVVGGDIGAMIQLGASGATQLCPLFQTTFQNGATNASSVEHQLSSSLGLSLGRAIRLTNTMQFIPFVQGGVQYVRQRYAYGSLGVGQNGEMLPGAWGHTNTVFGEMAAGFGLKVSDKLTLTPRYSIPMGVANRAGMYQQTYSLGVTLGLPR